ncbi:hypothetical protein SAMN05661008_01117 [Alkalithermobacter thermoalcaliphilus JW-YL-7 = DSM 7308]|uniref:Uncharacterized protein n=1 Tax=Alkalithermobacter thermoalcaliphilus JW-YL-7 = DSM 7308 TaxID=1121328 RepID=A0A150FNB8_CLOPD|nr:hypothetical protein JWYL7_0204 [[Clostridium] paradoxum JW-YL-7 = DSM 7308]SHK91192.1 hypothetical protein SAMN05661008_01117 [[Clostridium] paradoxum JW-YL-7 = DSM 7308]
MKFVFSKVTRSRLMGTVGLIICWRSQNDIITQYFLLDAEGLGIADYVSLKNADEDILLKEEERLMGGLGSERIYISEDEAIFLVNYFGTKNIKYNKILPGKVDEYRFMIDKQVKNIDIFPKICKDIESEIELVNYIVMRFIARDKEALKYFSVNEDIPNMYVTSANGTLLKNIVSITESGKYKCIALFEDNNKYYKMNIALRISGNKLVSLIYSKKVNVDYLYVLDELKKYEYITLYIVDDKEFKDKFYNDHPYCMKTEFENGVMFTEFKKNNDHVKKDIYIINDDIKSIYYITNANQLIIASYDESEKEDIKKFIGNKYKGHIKFKDEYIFEGSIIYGFAQDGFCNFYDFVNI